MFLIAVKILGQTVEFGFVKHTEVFADRCFGVYRNRHVESGIDGIFLVPAFRLDGVADRAIAEQFEVVERVAIENVAAVATFKFEFAVDFDQASQ